MATLTAIVFVGGITVFSSIPSFAAPAAPLGGCGDNLESTLNGAYAQWTLSCSGGQITVNGRVDDTGLDGQCVGVRGEFASGETERVENCGGWNTSANFNWTHPGSIADVYLYEFDG
jgi:hypothetical protein